MLLAVVCIQIQQIKRIEVRQELRTLTSLNCTYIKTSSDIDHYMAKSEKSGLFYN